MNAIIDNLETKIETQSKKIEIDLKEAWAWLYDNIQKLDKEAVDKFHRIFGRKRGEEQSPSISSMITADGGVTNMTPSQDDNTIYILFDKENGPREITKDEMKAMIKSQDFYYPKAKAENNIGESISPESVSTTSGGANE